MADLSSPIYLATCMVETVVDEMRRAKCSAADIAAFRAECAACETADVQGKATAKLMAMMQAKPRKTKQG